MYQLLKVETLLTEQEELKSFNLFQAQYAADNKVPTVVTTTWRKGSSRCSNKHRDEGEESDSNGESKASKTSKISNKSRSSRSAKSNQTNEMSDSVKKAIGRLRVPEQAYSAPTTKIRSTLSVRVAWDGTIQGFPEYREQVEGFYTQEHSGYLFNKTFQRLYLLYGHQGTAVLRCYSSLN